MVYSDVKDLPRRTASDKVLLGKAFNILLIIRNMIDMKGADISSTWCYYKKGKNIKSTVFRGVVQANY